MSSPIDRIEDHPDFGDVLDQIEKYGDWNKSQLIDALYDSSGDGETKKELNCYSRGKLLSLLIDELNGRTFQ